MSERPHYTSPSVASSAAEENPNTTSEKRHEKGASSIRDFRQNHTRRPLVAPTQPHELTAEWTVRAQLTFARAGEKVRREFNSNDPQNPVRVVYKWSTLDATATSVDHDDDDFADDVDVDTSPILRRTTSSHCSGQSTPQKRSTPATPKRHQSFRSTSSSLNAAITGEPGVDSAFSSKQHSSSSVPNGSGIATAAFYGTRCRSTCNIVVSAVADLLPLDVTTTDSFVPNTPATTASDFLSDMVEPDPFVYNTTASYTVLPQKSVDDNSTTATTSKNFTTFGRIFALRDAFSQTSDTETRYFEQHEAHDNRRIHQQQHRPYEQRRSTAEGLMRPTVGSTKRSSNADNEGKASMPTPSYTPSTCKSASMSRIPSLLNQLQQQSSSKYGSTEQQKKPRTVHIDVYCTGSEEDEHADAEASSSSSDDDDDDDDSERHEVDSNSTPQTVLDNDQMRLRHQRITGQALPRRLATQQKQQQQQRQENLSSQSDLNVGHGVTKSSTAEEVSESKQLLFRKHIGDQRAAKLAILRQKYLRQPSDDALSSTYPNSSHSTVRDATCSSISSTVPSLHTQHDTIDSSYKETEEAEDYHSIAKSDSFDYAHSVDRFRIRQMEKYWSRDDEDPRPQQLPSQPQYQPHQRISHSPTKSHYLQTISEVNSQPNSPYCAAVTPAFFQRNDTITSDLETFSESDVFCPYPGSTPNSAGFLPYQRQLSQPTPRILHTPSPPKTLKPPSPVLQSTPHFSRNRPGFLQFFGPHTAAATDSSQTTPNSPMQPTIESAQTQATNLLYPSYQPNLQRWKSETKENFSSSNTAATSEHSERTSPQIVSSPYTPPTPQRCGSEAPPTTTSASILQPSPVIARRFDVNRCSPTVSDTPAVVPGYTQEYLEKARKFGKVVQTVRKPGHHVGPTKNPNCSCESCQRWMAERFQLRGRAFSLGERPILKRPTRH